MISESNLETCLPIGGTTALMVLNRMWDLHVLILPGNCSHLPCHKLGLEAAVLNHRVTPRQSRTLRNSKSQEVCGGVRVVTVSCYHTLGKYLPWGYRNRLPREPLLTPFWLPSSSQLGAYYVERQINAKYFEIRLIFDSVLFWENSLCAY